MWKKYSLLALALVLVFCLALTACQKGMTDKESENSEVGSESVEPGTELAKTEKAFIAERFAVAALSCDKEGIKACVYEQMQEAFVKAYGENEYVFSNVTAEATDEIIMIRDGLELYTSTISREFGVKTMLDSASDFTVNFTAEYNGKAYTGAMSVVVAGFENGEYVISAQLDRMEDAFYEDNCPDGDFYFDMHGEE